MYVSVIQILPDIRFVSMGKLDKHADYPGDFIDEKSTSVIQVSTLVIHGIKRVA